MSIPMPTPHTVALMARQRLDRDKQIAELEAKLNIPLEEVSNKKHPKRSRETSESSDRTPQSQKPKKVYVRQPHLTDRPLKDNQKLLSYMLSLKK